MLLAACAAFAPKHEHRYAPPPGICDRTFSVSPDFSAEEDAALNRAVARWNYIAIEQFCLSSGYGNERNERHAIFKMVQYSPEYWVATKDTNVIGLTWEPDDRIAIMAGLDIEIFELTALHELGHAHELGHTACPAIMCPNVGTTDDFTDIDMAACRAAHVCPEDSDGGTLTPREWSTSTSERNFVCH